MGMADIVTKKAKGLGYAVSSCVDTESQFRLVLNRADGGFESFIFEKDTELGDKQNAANFLKNADFERQFDICPT